jgi:hypothetical protein
MLFQGMVWNEEGERGQDNPWDRPWDNWVNGDSDPDLGDVYLRVKIESLGLVVKCL